METPTRSAPSRLGIHLSLPEKATKPLKAALAVTLYCVLGSLPFVYGEGLNWDDAIYFMCVTMATVGYGDISPTSDGGKFFIIVWIFVAVVVVFPMVTSAIVVYTETLTQRARQLLEFLVPPKLFDVDGDGTADFRLPERTSVYFFAKNMGPAVLVWLILQLGAAAVFVALEGWYYGDAVYHCIITATTVGYGDMSISTGGGKAWACFHILTSVAMLAELVSTFDTLRTEWAEKRGKMEELDKKLHPNLAENLLETIESLDPTAKGKDAVSQMQFVLSMLVQSGALSDGDMAATKAIFAKAKVDEDGLVSKASVKESVREMQASLAVAAKAAGFVNYVGSKIHPAPVEPSKPTPPAPVAAAPPAAPPTPRGGGLSEDDLMLIDKEANGKLGHLTKVRLSVVKKQIELLFPIEFKGAKAGGAGPELADEATVRQICKESAEALLVVNGLLTAKGFSPFGLLIGGHTSAESDTSKQTSYERALAAGMLLAEELKDGASASGDAAAGEQLVKHVGQKGKGELPGGGAFLSCVGYSATCPLPGFADGQNHKENRRVEILLVDGEGQ